MGQPVGDAWGTVRISGSNTKESSVIWQQGTLESPVSRGCRGNKTAHGQNIEEEEKEEGAYLPASRWITYR